MWLFSPKPKGEYGVRNPQIFCGLPYHNGILDVFKKDKGKNTLNAATAVMLSCSSIKILIN